MVFFLSTSHLSNKGIPSLLSGLLLLGAWLTVVVGRLLGLIPTEAWAEPPTTDRPTATASTPMPQPFLSTSTLNTQRQIVQVYLPSQLYTDRPTTLTFRNKAQVPFRLELTYIDAYKRSSTPIYIQYDASLLNPQTGIGKLPLPPLPPTLPTVEAEGSGNGSPVAPPSTTPPSPLAVAGWQVLRIQYAPEAGQAPSLMLQFMGADGLPLQQTTPTTLPSTKATFVHLPIVSSKNGSGLGLMPSLPGMNPQTLRGVSQLAEFAGNEEKRKRLMDDGTRNTNRSIDRNTFSLPNQNPLNGL